MSDTPNTLIEAVKYFADPGICNDYMRRIKWPDGKVTCPECGANGDRIGDITSRAKMQCKDCRTQFSYKVGTIFEDSPLGLDKWFVAVWSIANCKNGISSHELGRAIGVTQKTAWFMLHRIRLAMEAADGGKFGGPTEADTTYVGGKAANMHKARREKLITGRGTVGKTAVHGVLQRTSADQHSMVRCDVIGRDDADTLVGLIRRHIKRGAEVYTDAANAYAGLSTHYYHDAIDHSVAYVADQIHTNGVENFWSLLKRSIKGTYVAIAPFHLFRYVAEQTRRFNRRKMTDGQRFDDVMRNVIGRRLTFRVLCAIDGAGFMGLE